MTAEPVALINPLPAALHHYERELLDVLSACEGVVAESCPSIAVEMADGDPSSRWRRTTRLLADRIGRERPPALRLVIWPVFGLADPASWWRRRHRVWLIVHDPEPLREQVGMGRLAAWAGGVASRHGVGVIAHTQPAADVLAAKGWQTTTLPHPIIRPDRRVGAAGSRLTVLGQWKPARAIRPLELMAAAANWDGRRDIVGRGWREVDGWSVESRFVTEAELVDRIDRSACVMLPYDRYFQSNIAARCLEQRRPVVGLPHPFLQSLYGADWPGLVEGDDWAGAVARAVAVTPEELERLREDYWERCVASWQHFVRQVVSPRPSSPRAH